MWWGNPALVEVVHWACVPRGGHRRVEYLQALVALGDAWLHHLLGECCKDNEGWRGHHFWWLEFELELSSLYVEGSARCSSILLM